MATKAFVAVGLVLLTGAVYLRVANYGFVNFDDDVHVYANPFVNDGLTVRNVAWAFGIHGPSQWHPLAWLSHQLDCQVYGIRPEGHHVTNLVLHMANVVLLFLFLSSGTRSVWPSAFVAAVFAVHPLNVESVAWISERRNVLSLFLGLLTMIAYLWYVRRGGPIRYGLVLVTFALALMAKPLVVTLPFVLLLVDFWPLRRLSTDGGAGRPQPTASGSACGDAHAAATLRLLLLEKVPLLLLSAGASVLTIWCQEGVVVSTDQLSWDVRVLNSLAAYGLYLKKIVWPSDLGVFYPHPGFFAEDPVSELVFPAAVSAVLLFGITTGALFWRHRHPSLPVGWFWFLGTLVPMIGLVQVGRQQMADRYVYLPLIGLLIAVTWTTLAVVRSGRGLLMPAVSLVIIALCSIVTWNQLPSWRNSVALFEQALAVTERNTWAHNNLGLALSGRGNFDGAVANYVEALRIDPEYGLARYNLGVALHDMGRTNEAIGQFEDACRLMPEHVDARLRLGVALADIGQMTAAVGHFQRATEMAPQNADAHFNLGLALARQGNDRQALAAFRRVLQLDRSNVKANYALAEGLLKRGDLDEAEKHFTRLIEIAPSFALAHNGLGEVLLEQGDRARALSKFREALRLDPDLTEAAVNIKRTAAP